MHQDTEHTLRLRGALSRRRPGGRLSQFWDTGSNRGRATRVAVPTRAGVAA